MLHLLYLSFPSLLFLFRSCPTALPAKTHACSICPPLIQISTLLHALYHTHMQCRLSSKLTAPPQPRPTSHHRSAHALPLTRSTRRPLRCPPTRPASSYVPSVPLTLSAAPTSVPVTLTHSSVSPSPSVPPPFPQCWNCNGLSARLRSASDTAAIKRFLVEQAPDVLFLSEVRLPAAHNAGNRKPSQLTAWFRSRVRDSDPASSNDFALLVTFLRAPECRHYRIWYSLADHKYSGTAMLLNTLTTAPPSSIRFNMDTLDVKRSVHHPQGRVIFAKFASFSILHT